MVMVQMKKLAFYTLALTSIFAGEDDWSLNNSFTFWGDAAFYRRAQTHKHRLVIDHSSGKLDSCSVCQFDACYARHLVKQFDYEPGYQVGMAYMTRHTMWEATYLWISDWESCCHRHTPEHIYFSRKNPDFIEGFSKADSGKACYASRFQNAELNYFRYVTPHRGNRFSAAWLAGIRYINVTEELEIGFIKRSNHSSYDVHAWNNIGGLQVGGTVVWNPMKTLGWDLIAKAGIGFDWDAQRTKLRDNTEALRNYKKSGFATPLLLDAKLSLTYQPWKYLNLHAAYQFIYLNGVALAPDQLVKKPSNDHVLRSNGVMWIHGWTAGLALSF